MKRNTELENKATSILSSDKILNVDMLQAIVRSNAEVIYAHDGTVLLLNLSGEVYMLNAFDKAGADAALNSIQAMDCCVAHGNTAMDAIRTRYGLDGWMDCAQCVYTGDRAPNVDSRFRIRRLTAKDAPFVKEHYKHDPQYIDSRIEAGMFGAELAAEPTGRLLGFIGTHDDGSIGLLEVAPDSRRMGVATALQAFMFDYHIKKGWIPYGQVYIDNDASFALQSSMGIAVSKQHIRWMFKNED